MIKCVRIWEREKRNNNLKFVKCFNTLARRLIAIHEWRPKESKAVFVKSFVVGFTYQSVFWFISTDNLNIFHGGGGDGDGDSLIYPTYERVQLDCVRDYFRCEPDAIDDCVQISIFLFYVGKLLKIPFKFELLMMFNWFSIRQYWTFFPQFIR